eukprot:5823017-Amphidinium_carterae.1
MAFFLRNAADGFPSEVEYLFLRVLMRISETHNANPSIVDSLRAIFHLIHSSNSIQLFHLKTLSDQIPLAPYATQACSEQA